MACEPVANELRKLELSLSQELMEATHLCASEDDDSDSDDPTSPQSVRALSLMQEELRQANTRMLADVVAGHRATAARRKAAMDRIMAMRHKPNVLTAVENEHKAAAARRDAALQRVLDFQRDATQSVVPAVAELPAECEACKDESDAANDEAPSAVQAVCSVIQVTLEAPRAEAHLADEVPESAPYCRGAGPKVAPKRKATWADAPSAQLPWERIPGDHLRIERRGCRKLPFVVTRCIRWQFRVRDYTINFGIYKRAMSKGGAVEVELVPVATFRAGQTHRGEWTTDDPATVVLVFDNSFSFFRAKEVVCVVDVETDDKPGESWQTQYRREWEDLHSLDQWSYCAF